MRMAMLATTLSLGSVGQSNIHRGTDPTCEAWPQEPDARTLDARVGRVTGGPDQPLRASRPAPDEADRSLTTPFNGDVQEVGALASRPKLAEHDVAGDADQGADLGEDDELPPDIDITLKMPRKVIAVMTGTLVRAPTPEDVPGPSREEWESIRAAFGYDDA